MPLLWNLPSIIEIGQATNKRQLKHLLRNVMLHYSADHLNFPLLFSFTLPDSKLINVASLYVKEIKDTATVDSLTLTTPYLYTTNQTVQSKLQTSDRSLLFCT